MMVALLLYAYARGNRSSRRIERSCVEDVAYRVIAGNLVPDHSTIAEFRARHEDALAELFSGVLGLCARAGLVSVGVIAIDGTKVLANASHERNLDYRQVAERILAEAERIDREEDELYGEARGDELPEHLRTAEGRRAALRKAKEELECERAGEPVEGESDLELEFDSERVGLIRGRGRRGWSADARHQLDEHRRRQKRPVPNGRQERLLEARRRLLEQHQVEIEANRRYELWYSGRDPNGVKKPRSGPALSQWVAPAMPEGKINLTDPDSRVMQSTQRWVQGYNAQSAVTPGQIMVAAEISVLSPDFGQLEPMVQAAERELERAGVSGQPGAVVADAGYWHTQQMERLAARGIPALIPPDANTRQGQRPGWSGGLYAFMRPGVGQRRRSSALSATPNAGRAGVRAHQAQPQDRPVHAKRQIGGAVGVAVDRSHTQPPQTPPAHDSRSRHWIVIPARPSAAATPRLRGTAYRYGFTRQPLSQPGMGHHSFEDAVGGCYKMAASCDSASGTWPTLGVWPLSRRSCFRQVAMRSRTKTELSRASANEPARYLPWTDLGLTETRFCGSWCSWWVSKINLLVKETSG